MSLFPPLERHPQPLNVAGFFDAYIFIPAPSVVLACTLASLSMRPHMNIQGYATGDIHMDQRAQGVVRLRRPSHSVSPYDG